MTTSSEKPASGTPRDAAPSAGRPLNEWQLRHWMQRLGPAMLALSCGICRDRQPAEDIVQEAFTRLWRTPPDVGEVAYSAWLRRVVTNLSINCLTRTRRAGELPEFSSERAMQTREFSPQRRAELSDEQQQLHAALDRLDESKRAILLLRAVEGLSYEAIAATLEVPIGTVMSRLNRARAALAQELDGGEAGSDAEPAAIDIRRFRRAASG
jgi:RNA polymerase sigma-70 factor (ECF subfamily)